MTTILYVATISLPLITILIAVGMWYRATVLKARARLANDDAYKQIAETAAKAQTDTAQALASIEQALADVRTRMAAVEKVLKDVG
jgi:hypothetical protein